jgi:homoserine kinase type II
MLLDGLRFDSVPADIRPIVQVYGARSWPVRIEALGSAGGFSGAKFWRLESPQRMLCLRRWPSEFPDPTRLTFIHSVLAHVADRGVTNIPLPVRTANGRSFIFDGEHLWELTNWLPGVADYLPERRPEKLAAAMRALAEWHLAAADFPHGEPTRGVSPGIASRRDQMQRICLGGLQRLADALDATQSTGGIGSELVDLGRRLVMIYPRVQPKVRCKLRAVGSLCVPLQPCIRDVWHDHVLFEGDRVSGLVDFGAVRVESVAGDVARLLDSLAGDDLTAWQQGLAEYSRVRPLSRSELDLVDAFDESLTLLSAMNWLDWIFILRRKFDNLTQIISRVTTSVNRLEVSMAFQAFRF